MTRALTEPRLDFSKATSLAQALNFHDTQLQHFGAPRASSTPLRLENFEGEVTRGASCNCSSISLVPHCNGTHTESASHLTIEQRPLYEFIPLGPIPALLLTVSTTLAASCAEGQTEALQAGDHLITRHALLHSWQNHATGDSKALLLRIVGPADAANPPYFTPECMSEIVARGIQHLVVDLPSVDRTEDNGRLAAHRIFFGLPIGANQLSKALRPEASITELAHFPSHLVDGPCAVQLQITPFSGDAVPSRPLHIPFWQI